MQKCAIYNHREQKTASSFLSLYKIELHAYALYEKFVSQLIANSETIKLIIVTAPPYIL